MPSQKGLGPIDHGTTPLAELAVAAPSRRGAGPERQRTTAEGGRVSASSGPVSHRQEPACSRTSWGMGGNGHRQCKGAATANGRRPKASPIKQLWGAEQMGRIGEVLLPDHLTHPRSRRAVRVRCECPPTIRPARSPAAARRRAFRTAGRARPRPPAPPPADKPGIDHV